MTTIAFRAGIIASDSCWADEKEHVDTLSTKITRLKSGALLGAAGCFDIRPLVKLLEHVKAVRYLPSHEALCNCRVDAKALLILPGGRIVKVETTATAPDHWDAECIDVGAWEIDHDFAAIGSGSAFALGAMEAGASAKRAVQIACRRDINSRAPVHTLTLGRSI